jgi:hypothetical protein
MNQGKQWWAPNHASFDAHMQNDTCVGTVKEKWKQAMNQRLSLMTVKQFCPSRKSAASVHFVQNHALLFIDLGRCCKSMSETNQSI